MKLTKRQLKKIIREEYSKLLREHKQADPEWLQDMALAHWDEDDYEGWIEFAAKYGLSEEEADVMFDNAEFELGGPIEGGAPDPSEWDSPGRWNDGPGSLNHRDSDSRYVDRKWLK